MSFNWKLNFQGYIDGAVESGYRVANEILHNSFRNISNVKVDYESTYYHQEELVKKNTLARKQQKNSGCCIWKSLIYILLAVSLIFLVLNYSCCFKKFIF